ncbi:DUF1015 family protein [Sciscionella sediminilitoris]|uniref:DUF1015 family protein n=1 Tax=Sciscionella sediminilitoris TaxID=1445613 RepID=UPI00068CBB72|nr:DUF1015 family protein [Sciscionella sp. SE31]
MSAPLTVPTDVLRTRAPRLRLITEEDREIAVPVPSVVVYRVESGGHRQTGILVEVAVDDYRAGRIRRHEETQPDRVRLLSEQRAADGFEQVPVTLAQSGRPALRSLLARITGHPPWTSVTTPDGAHHQVWVCEDPELLRATAAELAATELLYIADGHHRMAAADQDGAALSAGELEQQPANAFTLAAVFPAEELRILGYHRHVPRPHGESARELLARLTAAGPVRAVEPHPVPESAPGEVAMWLDGNWYRLRLAGDRAELDVVTLDEQVLAPVFGIGAATPFSGTAAEVAAFCAEHETIGFLPHPPSIDAVLAIADAGATTPPKSTWFDPKIRSALFRRALR